MLTGNVFHREVDFINKEIPENLQVGRLVCRVFDSFQSATKTLEEDALKIESILIMNFNQVDGKEAFVQVWRKTVHPQNSVLLFPNKALAEGIDGLVFYATEIRPYDFFYKIRTGDILDYQLPTGKFNIDMTPDCYENRERGGIDKLVKTTPHPGISIVQEEYTRFYFIKGNAIDHLMLDTGFGREDLKALQKKHAPGTWQVALTHGHKDHSGGCTQFSKLFGNKINLEAAGVFYSGQMQELREGNVFRIGHHKITAIDLSGHSFNDFGFYIEPEKILVAGDAIASGPNYTMCRGGNIDRWIASLERLQQKCMPYGNMEIKELWCTHREGRFENPVEAIQQMKDGLQALKEGRGERYGATVYGFGAVKWMKYGEFSYFYKEEE